MARTVSALVRYDRLTTRNYLDVQCPYFLVPLVEQLDTLILGTRDILANFAVESTWDGTTFTLNRDHLGEAA